MARPKTPLISRQAAVKTALELIDEEGVDKFSMRRLGARLGVHGMSLYHHFQDKDEIMSEVVSFALSELRPLPPPTHDIVNWTLANAKRYRQALLLHKNIIPLLIKGLPRQSRSEMYRQEFAALESLGIDRTFWPTVLKYIEAFILGTVIFLDDFADALKADDVEGAYANASFGRETDDQDFEFVFTTYVKALYESYRARSASLAAASTSRPAS